MDKRGQEGQMSSKEVDDSAKTSLQEHSHNGHSHDHAHSDSHGHSHDDSHSNLTTESQLHPDPPFDLQTTQTRQFYNIPSSMDFDEALYLIRTILSFKYYQRYTFAMNHGRMQQFYALPEAHRNLLQPTFTEKLEAIDAAIEENALIARRIARLGEEMYLDGIEVRLGGPISPRQKDMDKARSTLRQFVRDWSVEGSQERELCYTPILQALDALFGKLSPDQKAGIRVLVPGAGLGRIVYEILRVGYQVEGNELEFSMLMASNLALNELDPRNPYKLYPYIHTMSHHRTINDLVRCISIPDENPADGINVSGTKGQMSMVAGDFIDCYSSPEDTATFSVITTIFFLDTAPNVLKYIDTIHNVLEPGGIWINLGPLAWHFEPDEQTMKNGTGQVGGGMELCLDELVTIIQKTGFQFESGGPLDRRSIRTPYMGNTNGMLTYLYTAEFWVARKL